jgi:SAM-dependent methyltransferase
LKGIHAVVGDFSSGLPYSSGMFDIIFAGEVVEHVFDVDKFFDEVSRVLKPGGHLVLTTPNLARLSDRFRFLFGFSPKHVDPTHPYLKYHIHPFTMSSLNSALANNGFFVVSCRTNCVRIAGLYDSYLLGKVFPSLGNSLIILARR